MKCRSWLSLVALSGLAGGVCAQVPGYPPLAPYGAGPGPWQAPQYQPGTMRPAPAHSAPARQTPVQPAPARQAPAQPAPQQAAPAAPVKSPLLQASRTLKEGIDKLLTFVGQKETPNKLQTAAFLDREIAPYFDFEYMARWVAGPAYGRMGEADRKALSARLESSFLTALGGQLAGYQGQQVRMLRPRSGTRGTVSVNVGILRPGTYPSRLEFRMYQSVRGWKVYDVVANGRSAAAYYRTQFQGGTGQVARANR